MSEIRFPKIMVHEIVEEEGRKFTESLTPPVCDFCMDERATWAYECEDFALDTSDGPWGSANGWCACDVCSALVEGELWEGLVARVLTSWMKLGADIDANKAQNASRIIHGFVDHYAPGRSAFG